MDYAEIIRQLTHTEEEASDKWVIDKIIDHRWGRGSREGQLEVRVKWKDYDEPSQEPIQVIRKDDPITLANYAKEYGLLDKSKWKQTKRYLTLNKTSQRKIAQIYAKKTSHGKRYKFGVRVPRTVKEALKIDKEEGFIG